MSLPNPLPVKVIRPKPTMREGIVEAVASSVALALNAWILMLLLPVVTDWHVGYWQAVAAIVLVRTVSNSGISSYRRWTEEGKR